MTSAWSGDFNARIENFARAQGYSTIWDYLTAHPRDSLLQVAKTIGDAAAIQIERLIVSHCLASGLMSECIRDAVVRGIHAGLPGGWGSGNDFAHAMSLASPSGLSEPYAELALALSKALMKTSPPPPGWAPSTRDDPVLLDAYAIAIQSLPHEKQEMIRLGKWIEPPGSIYWAAIEPIWKTISIYDGPPAFLQQFAPVPRELGHLFAIHWCRSEICNGGFHQFFSNSTGVLAPEAAAGFAAIGMPNCEAVIQEAMRVFGRPYPRDREVRRETLGALPNDPFEKFDERFYGLLETENGGVDCRADTYAAGLNRSE